MRDLGERIIVHLVEQRAAGTTFPRRRAAWPLHLTIVPWFHVDLRRESAMFDALRRYLSRVRPCTVHVGGEEFFGPAKDIPVNTISDQAPLEQLHRDLTRIVQRCGAGASDAWREQQVFRAHITHLTSSGVTRRRVQGDKLAVATVTVARLLEDRGTQMVEIMEHLQLGGGSETAA